MKRAIYAVLGILIIVVSSVPYLIWGNFFKAAAILGYGWLFTCTTIANATVFIPSSSTLYVLLASRVMNPWLCCIVGGIGTAVGEQVSYLCGRIGRKAISDFSFHDKIAGWIKAKGTITVFIFALLPLPIFDFVGTAAGSCKMSWVRYTIAGICGKLLKMVISVAFVFYVLPILLTYNESVPREIIEWYNSLLIG